jgi:hypothetical protein
MRSFSAKTNLAGGYWRWWVRMDDVHVGFVVGLERAHIAPVQSLFLIFVDEVIGEDAIVADHPGEDVFAEVMAGGLVLGVFEQDGNEHVGIE